MSNTVPAWIGPYEITREIGRGRMGMVYLARDERLDREALARDKERVLRFQREAKLLASLNHTNIAQVCGFEESDSKKFVVLEYRTRLGRADTQSGKNTV